MLGPTCLKQGSHNVTDTNELRIELEKLNKEEEQAQERLEKLAEETHKKREAIKEKLREEDLKDVIAKCKLHGFTATNLRGALKTKGAKKKTIRKKVAKKKGIRKKKTAKKKFAT